MRAAGAIAAGLCMTLAVAACGGEDDGGRGAAHEFYGVVTAEPLPGAPELARLGRGGVGTLRINLPWGSVQNAPDAPYDWSRYDEVIARAAENGIRVFATIYSSPIWAEATPEHPPLGANLPGLAAFTRAAVERYGADGSFWKENRQLPELPITNWELWNEPNRTEFWPTGPDPAQYLILLRALSGAVKAADPSAQVVLAGLWFRPGPEDGVPLTDYLPALYEGGGASLFDAVAVHPYEATPQEALEAVGETRELMAGFGDAEKPIWVTEIGWATDGFPSGLTTTPEGQAQYLSESFALLAESRERLGIAGVIWYSLTDVAGGDLWLNHCGLFTIDGTPKPSWEAFVELTGGTP
jgi:hypothetical protein